MDDKSLSISRQDMNSLSMPVAANPMGAALAVREAKQVEGMMIMAKRFPRDMVHVEQRIIQNCRRQGLAEMAEYTYKRGGTDITGPSIRLAEVLMQSYGNILTGWQEIQRNSDNSDCEAFSWDIESNVKMSKVFNVPHYRDTKKGRVALKDDRDIREMCANQASRVLRGCILQVIPGDLVEMAVTECRRTLAADNTPLDKQAAKWIAAFSDDYKVDQKQLERYLGTVVAKWTKADIHRLRKLYNLIKNGEGTIEEALNIHAAKVSGTQIKELAALIMKHGQEKGMSYINMLGYAELKDIPLADFETVKEGLNKLGESQPPAKDIPEETEGKELADDGQPTLDIDDIIKGMEAEKK